MAKVIARKPDADVSEGVTVSFSRDQETGLFRKIEQKYSVSHLDYITKKIGKPEVSEDLYELSTSDSYEFKFEISAPGGTTQTLYFQKVEK